MFRIAVCDDSCLCTSEIENLLFEIAAGKGMDLEVDVFFDGRELEKSVNQGDLFDIIYLDLEMEKRTGIETAKNIRLHDPTVVLVYVSECSIAINELLEVEPFRLLGKPINRELFEKYFLDACHKILNSDIYYEFRFKRQIVKVPLNKVRYFESSKRTISLYMEEGTYKFYGKLNEVENNIGRTKFSFLRIHQSFLVNVKYVKRIGYNFAELIDGTILQMSEDRQKWIRHRYGKFLGGEVLN